MTAPTSVSTTALSRMRCPRNSSGISVSVAPAALPIPIAGHLAMGIGKAAGATLTLIPEEFLGHRIRLKAVVDTLVGAVIKRLSYGRLGGRAVPAEGLAVGSAPAGL